MTYTTSVALFGRVSALGLVSLCLSMPAFGQTRYDRARPDPETVVVTGVATATEQQQVGNSLTVVSGDRIEAQGYSYVADALRQVPGLAVNRGGSQGALTQVRIRGAEANHTLTLLDGVDISSPDQGEVDFSTLLSGDVERIEVLRGPQSGLYGSNALAGVINLITNRQVNGAYERIAFESGDENTARLEAAAGLGDGRSYLAASLHAMTTSGYDVSADHSAQGVASVGVGAKPGDKEGSRATTVYLRGGIAAASSLRFDGFVNYLDKTSDGDGQAFSAPIAGLTYDDASASNTRRWIAAASGTLDLMDGRWITVLRGSYLDEARRGSTTSFPFFGPITPAVLAAVTLEQNGADATRFKATLESTYAFGGADFQSHLTGFAESKRETYQNPFPSPFSPRQGARESRNLVGFGLQYRADIGDQVYLSGTYRHDENDDFKDADTYSIALSWVIPGTGARPHASYGKGVTNPTFFEQFGFDPGSFVGNPGLKPEEAKSWDIGIEQGLFEGRLVADVTYFESTLKHEIFTAFGGAPFFLSTPANRVTDSDRSGWEVSLSARPTDDLDLVASYTKLDATEPAGIEVRRPKDQAAFDGTWRVFGGPLHLNLGVTYTGEQRDFDFATGARVRQSPHTLVRIGASYRLTEQVEIYGRIENLGDASYEEVYSFRGAPRAAFVGIRFRDAQRN